MTQQRERSSVDTRRLILGTALGTAVSAVGLALAGCGGSAKAAGGPAPASNQEEAEEQVTPGEDLMQEHGLIERVLLVYEEAARRVERSEPFDPGVVLRGADIVRHFVQDYHEKQEEELVFPRLQQAGTATELVAVLLRQHQRGRELTDEIARRAKAGSSPELATALLRFSRMYRPHAAREDTVLFPAFRQVLGKGYAELGERFEENEHRLFGEGGFEKMVTQVAQLETELGIADLSQFTA